MDAYTGEIRLFAGNYAPDNWHACDGSQVSINDYQALYSLIGTTYGSGSGTFALPDLKGRLPVGVGQGPNQPNYTLAQTGGQEGVALLPENLPPHTHGIFASSSAAISAVPANTLALAAVDNSNLRFYVDTTQGTVTGTATLNPAVISTAGLGHAHDNIMPCTPLTYIICLEGLYPPQS